MIKNRTDVEDKEGEKKAIISIQTDLILLEVARNLFSTGMPLEQIGRVTGLLIKQLQYLQASEFHESNQ